MNYKLYQKEDLARLALHDGAILAWDKGGGKTLGMYSWCLLKCGLAEPRLNKPAAPCLLVAPGDVHDQVAKDGRDLLGADTISLLTQADFLRLSTQHPLDARRILPPGFYISSYTGLASNGVAAFPVPAEHSLAEMLELFSVTTEVDEFYAARGSVYAKHYERLEVGLNASWEQLEAAARLRRRNDPTNAGRKAIDDAFDQLGYFHPRGKPAGLLADLSPQQRQMVQWECLTRLAAEYAANIGQTRVLKGTTQKVKCVYSPSLSDLCRDSFEAVAVDEGVKMKGDETLVGLGLRQLNPPYRLVLSGTPIKNRLPDVFHLAHWATGHHDEPTSRWPYAAGAAEKLAFSEQFLLSERNLTKEQQSENGRRFVKLSPQVCNIHLLWKLFGPIILRRLKKDFGEDIVKKHRHVIRVPMGTAQARTYRYHCEALYKDCHGMKAVGAQLQALRTVAAAPHCGDLQRKPLPDNAKSDPSDFVSSETYIPKYAAALQLVSQVLQRGEQIVLFSSLLEPLHALSARLREAGVPHLVATGELSPARRRKISADFKQGPPKYQPPGSTIPNSQLYPVLLASDCMAEAHSWNRSNNLTHLAYSWAFDKLSQAIDRCHRINSVADLNYHALLCNGTTDRILENNLHEKSNTSDLVLDGNLMETNPEEMNLGAVLAEAMAEFSGDTETIDERVLEQDWPRLREELRKTYKEWVGGETVLQGSSSKSQVVPLEPSTCNLLPATPSVLLNGTSSKSQVVPLEPSTCNLPPVTPVPQLSTPIPLNPSMHPWKERHLRRVNLRQRQLTFA